MRIVFSSTQMKFYDSYDQKEWIKENLQQAYYDFDEKHWWCPLTKENYAKVREKFRAIPYVDKFENIAIIKNGYAFLTFSLDERVIPFVTYQIKNAKFLQNWDGKVCLYNRNLNSLPVGLLEMVEKVHGKIYVIFVNKQKHLDLVSSNHLDCRPYQVSAVEAAVKKRHGIIKIATAGGKTLIGLELIKRFSVRSIVFVPTKDLLYQWKKLIEKEFNIEVGVIGDGKAEIKDITVCTVQSAKREQVLPFDLAIFDEVHRLGARVWRKAGTWCGAKYRFGLSATPTIRNDGANLEVIGVTGGIVYEETTQDLTRQGYLTPCEVTFFDAPIVESYGSYQSIYQNQIVENEKRNRLIADLAKKEIEKQHQVLIMIDRIEHGNILSALTGFPFLHGSIPMDVRQQTSEKFKNKEIFGLIASRIFETGVDLPVIDVLFMASPLKAEISVIQRIGRGLRLSPGKHVIKIFDFKDNAKYLKYHCLRRKEAYLKEGHLIFGF